jgi:lysozyme
MQGKAAASKRLNGFDLSHYQTRFKIDWEKLKANMSFVFVKATEGSHYDDPTFKSNWAAAKSAGIVRGAYHYFRPGEPVLSQVENFVAVVQRLEVGDLPPVLDVENPKRWDGLTAKESVDMIVAWLTEVEKRLGVKPIIYASRSFVIDVLGSDPRLAGWVYWMARYRSRVETPPRPFKRWAFWQFTETGTAPGITGAVDLDVFNGTLDDLLKLTKQV